MKSTSTDLAACVRLSIEHYFRDLAGARPVAIYDMVLRNVERPMIEAVLAHAQGNQTQAAEILGITRSTLRKKIQTLQISL